MNPDDLDFGATLRGLLAGQHVFNRYQLTRILGQGGMGIVWLARDEQLDRDVALKFLPEMIANDRDAIEDMKRETRKALVLTHPRIVRIYDFIQDKSRAAVSMEYVDGATLSAMKYDELGAHFTPEKLTPWLEQLCEALTYAHNEAKIAHRDLKPANLIIDKNGMLKVTDFGISATLTDSTTRASHTASTSGTPVYMSPQQMLGQKAAPTDDVYSLGATIYELLTGKPPFYSGNIPMQVQGVVPPSMAERRAELGVANAAPIPDAWEATVAACLAKEAKDRPQSAAEVWDRLNGKVVEAKKAVVEKKVPEKKLVRAPSNPKKPLLMTLAACALVALVAFGWWQGIRVPELERQAEQARQLEVARQEAADKAAEAQRLREEQARKDAAEKAERERLAAEQEKRDADARAEAARLAAVEANAKGTLVVESNPSGATVIDSTGKNCGTTPLRFDEIKPGNYTVTLKASGYEDATVSGAVVKRETLRLYAAMKPVQQASVAQTTNRPTNTRSSSGNAPASGSNYTVPSYNIELVWITPGSFTMGSPSGESSHDSDETQHRVTLSKGYWLGKYEVTQGQWAAVMGTTVREQRDKANTSWSMAGEGADNPMYYVSWDDAMAFCKKLTEKERAAGSLPSGYEYSLPTEAQWEYACRAGTSGAYGGNGSLGSMGWYGDNSGSMTHAVRQKQSNAWDLYDMHGNVWEWCNDWYGTYPSGSVTDPTGANTGSDRVLRGGSWYDDAQFCRSANRGSGGPGNRGSYIGFRLALRSVQ